MEMERQNPHWAEGYIYPYEKKRFIFEELRQATESGLITAIYGLRRVGKSVLLKQIINEAIKNRVKRTNILYFSFDEENEDFWEVIREYEKRIGRKVSKENYVLLDEIQKVHDWKGKVKRLYDSSLAKIVLSGSNSSMLRKEAESLAGRINEFLIPELSFKEFLFFKNRSELYASPLDEAIENEFWVYIQRPFPELAVSENIEPRAYIETINRKIIYEDLPSIFPIDDPQLLYRLFNIICKNPGMIVEYNALASDLGRNRKTISAYLDYLKYGFLIRRLFNYSKNLLTREKKLKKFYPSLACFTDAETSKIVETVVAQILKAGFFWNHKNRYEVDFILSEPFFAFEVKYKEKISGEDLKGLEQFKAAYKTAETILITKKRTGNAVPYYKLDKFIEDKNIRIKVTLEDFFL